MSDRPEEPEWKDDVGERRHGRNWIADHEDDGRTRDYGEPARYGDERDEAFEMEETSEPGSLSPEDALPHPADQGEAWQVGQRDGTPVITKGDAENVPVPRKDET